jgi:hypothetical protein
MTHLYPLKIRYQQLLDKEELSADECAELEALHADSEDHCIDRAKYIRNLQAELMAVEVAQEEMKQRATELENRIASKEKDLMEYMRLHNHVKITKSPLFPIKTVKNRVRVDDYNRQIIPDKYWYYGEPVIEHKLDKEAVRKDIESGVEVPGAKLVQGVRLSFK